MIKLQGRSIGIIVILLMFSTSLLSITDSFADLIDYQDEKDDNQDAPKDIPNSRLRVILNEKLVNGKLQVRHYTLTADFSNDDENDKYISFVNYGLNPEMSKNIKFLQVGELAINSKNQMNITKNSEIQHR